MKNQRVFGISRWAAIGTALLMALFSLTGCGAVRVVTPAGQSAEPGWPGRTVDVLNGTTAVLQVVAAGKVACRELQPQGLCPVTFFNYSGRSYRTEIAVTGTRDGRLAGINSRSVYISANNHDREVWEVRRLHPLRLSFFFNPGNILTYFLGP